MSDFRQIVSELRSAQRRFWAAPPGRERKQLLHEAMRLEALVDQALQTSGLDALHAEVRAMRRLQLAYFAGDRLALGPAKTAERRVDRLLHQESLFG